VQTQLRVLQFKKVYCENSESKAEDFSMEFDMLNHMQVTKNNFDDLSSLPIVIEADADFYNEQSVPLRSHHR